MPPRPIVRTTSYGPTVFRRAGTDDSFVRTVPGEYPGGGCPAQPARRLLRGSGLRREEEDLERSRRLEHDLAVVVEDPAAGDLLDRADRGRGDGFLEGEPVVP